MYSDVKVIIIEANDNNRMTGPVAGQKSTGTKGNGIVRISVKRTYWPHHAILVRIKTIRNGLKTLLVTKLSDARSDETGPAPLKNRRCAA
jgi:hypothetical protein